MVKVASPAGITAPGATTPVAAPTATPKVTPSSGIDGAATPPAGHYGGAPAHANHGAQKSWVSLLPAVPEGGPKNIKHTRAGTWTPIDPATLVTLDVANPPAVCRFAQGQKVEATIKGSKVTGRYVGFDYQGRPVIEAAGGTKRIAGSFDDVSAVGPQQPVQSPLAGLDPTAVVRAPETLETAMQAALDLKVTGSHTAREYVDALHAEGYHVYVVGGAIRDALHTLAEDPAVDSAVILDKLKDIDVVTTAPPPEIRRIAAKVAPEYAGGAVYSPPIVDQFGAVLVGGPKAGLSNPEGIDIVSIKSTGDSMEQVSHPDTTGKAFPNVFGRSLAEDTQSRDFACNSLFYDPLNKAIVDPTGDGIADAQNKFLRVSRKNLDKDDSVGLRYLKFRLRGYTTDKKNLGIVRSQVNRVLFGPTWKATMALSRIGPKTPKDMAAIDDWFARLRGVMKADGVGKAHDVRVKKIRPKVTKRLAKGIKG